MPPRRPRGSATSLGTTIVAILTVLPVLAAAQQQHQPQDAKQNALRSHETLNAFTPGQHANVDSGGSHASEKRNKHIPIASQNERAIATLPSAPAASLAAVREHPNSAASQSAGLSSRPRARSLQDWGVEDFVLLATVDGHVHARDRNTGDRRWEWDGEGPLVETVYHKNEPEDGEDDEESAEADHLWIVEPSESGKIYVYTPGPNGGIQSLGLTVKQLVEDYSPFKSPDPFVVYTGEKKNQLYTVDARTGVLRERFHSGGSSYYNNARCKLPNEFGNENPECRGSLTLARAEYTVYIHGRRTGKPICTIKYFEWNMNNRDRDLHSQYTSTMDNIYVYSRYDGSIFAWDHTLKEDEIPTRLPLYQAKFSAPVVQVFDVARPFDDDSGDPSLIILPQPTQPSFLDDKTEFVWVNCTEAGSWYAMSELHYPAVTDGASKAGCYNKDVATWEGIYQKPMREELVGVHSLATLPKSTVDYQMISGPDPVEEVSVHEDTPTGSSSSDSVVTTTAKETPWATPALLTVILLLFFFGVPQDKVKDALLFSKKVIAQYEQKKSDVIVTTVDAHTPATQADSAEPIDKKVRFEEPEKDVDPVENVSNGQAIVPLLNGSAEVSEPTETTEAMVDSPMAESPTLPEEEKLPQSPQSTDSTPIITVTDVDSAKLAADGVKPKKKAHRGQRGGRKRRKNTKANSEENGALTNGNGNEDEEISRIVEVAKQIGEEESLQADEVTTIGRADDPSGSIQIGKLTINTDRVLGNGSGGTFVFEGKWKEREVAVKRMLPQYFGLAEQEVSLLQQSDLHPNVIRYFDDERDQNFLYIAVELCQASLWDLYRDGKKDEALTDDQERLFGEINGDMPKALFQLAAGLNHLHGLRIIHRDIKPQNILIAYRSKNQVGGPRLVISDFGLCKTLPDNVSTLAGTTGSAGTTGWKAPELILVPKDSDGRQSSTAHSRDSSTSTDPVAQGVKRAVDIFSLGCVYYYVLTNGQHPFDDHEGWMGMREMNIKKNKWDFRGLERFGDDIEEPLHLITWMLNPSPEHRPTALQVMQHPFFWSPEKRLSFLCDVSDHWEREPRDPPSEHLAILQSYVSVIMAPNDFYPRPEDFLGRLDRKFIDTLGKQRKYTTDRVLDLLRALRNKKNHYEDMPPDVKARVGELPDGYLRYWTTRFPKLLMACYNCVIECSLQSEPRFRAYFEGAAIM